MPEHDDFFQTTLPAHRPTWAEIDLDAFYHNYAAIKKRVGPGVKIIGVVKGGGYGFGRDFMAKLLAENGIDMFAVTEVEDAEALSADILKGKDILQSKR